MTAAAVDHMWRRVLTRYRLPSDGAAVAETDCMWKEILKEKGLPLDYLFERLDKDTVPLRIPSKREDEKWAYDQKRKLGDAGYEEMMRKKTERFHKYLVAEHKMTKMLKKAGKERTILEEQEALGLIYDYKKKKSSEWLTRYTKAAAKKRKNLEDHQEALGLLFDKKRKKKKTNKRKRHGDDEKHNKKKMKKATTSSSSS